MKDRSSEIDVFMKSNIGPKQYDTINIVKEKADFLQRIKYFFDAKYNADVKTIR